jgi:hypothetical protein
MTYSDTGCEEETVNANPRRDLIIQVIITDNGPEFQVIRHPMAEVADRLFEILGTNII